MKTRFTRLDDFYKAVDNLIEGLKTVGHPDEANKLDSLMHHTAWTTSSELLGELTLELKNMKGNYSSDITKEIAECLEFTTHHRKILGLG